MKNNQGMAWILVAVVLMQFGFDWGAPKNPKNNAPAASSATKTVELPFAKMMEILSQNMTLWTALSKENKKKAIEAAIRFYGQTQNVAILKGADFYVTQIDQGFKANPSLQRSDLMTILKMMAVMEFDFYNGQNKDALAKEVLGEKMYQSLRSSRPA